MNQGRVWRLDSSAQTLVFASRDGEETPECLYWGAPLPAGEDLETLAFSQRRAAPVALFDSHAPLSICPEERRGWLGRPGLIATTLDGRPLSPRFSIADVESSPNSLVFGLQCADSGTRLRIGFALDADTDMITATAELTGGEAGIRLGWLTVCALPVPDHVEAIVDFSGRWIGEFQLQQTPWTLGTHQRESREGRTGHAHFPGVILPGRNSGNGFGEVYALHLGWSGGHRSFAEELSDGRRQVQVGAFLRPGEISLEEGETHTTPPLFAAFSAGGINGTMDAFHRHARARIVGFPDPARPRPVHYHCWEAVYFNHDVAILKDIAGKAAALGAERFVLDDGWFPGRADDTAGLGDWVVDVGKFPNGLGPLIDHVESLGMRFGLWVEPEMINVDSDLHRYHPDWVLGGDAQDQPSGRQQYVLDLSRPEVTDHLFTRIDDLLSAYRIDYLKWDHNRPLIGGSGAQTHAFYGLIDRLRAAHPDVEIESCASGGGRTDFGVLKRTHRVWLSDSNDALVRLGMQHNAVLFLPPEITGSHVGPRVCHTSGRTLPMSFRAWVAAQRH
ncbi:MAG: alpha-galactosidase, partial [Rhodospirillales bacterium]|nr:alpha-galactosidase [Rhodospirillales bacterium]